RFTKATTVVNLDVSGKQPGGEAYVPRISPDGRHVSFCGTSDGYVPGDVNGCLDDFVHGRWLNLEADPPAPPAGATLTFSTWRGLPSGATLLAAIDLNGTPLFVPVVFGAFDATGVWSLALTVPPGLSGNVATFVSFGIVPTGKVDASGPFVVSFQ